MCRSVVLLTAHQRSAATDLSSLSRAGPKMRGKLIPGGGDWEVVEEDGTAHLDTRYVMEVPKA